MEYRRRRKRARARYRAHSARTGGGGAAGGAIVSLLLIAGIIYLLASSSAGAWMAKNVMAPAIAFFAGDKSDEGADETPDETIGPGESTGSLDLSEGDAAPVSAQITFPGVTCYMLQMGVFSSRANADAQAQTLQARGGAGFVLEDSSSGELRYRVMAAGYEERESANSVKERLAAEGADCTLYTLESVSAVFRVTAPEEDMEGVRAGFEALANARKSLAQAALSFDKDTLSVTQGKSEAEKILQSLEREMGQLASFAPDGGALSRILDEYAIVRASLGKLVEDDYESTVDFSAAMKYTYLNITNQYAALTQALAG